MADNSFPVAGQVPDQPHRLEADPQRIRATWTGLQPRSNRHAPAQSQSASNRLDQLVRGKTPSVLDHRLIPLASCAYIFVGNWFGLIGPVYTTGSALPKWLEWPLGTGCPDVKKTAPARGKAGAALWVSASLREPAQVLMSVRTGGFPLNSV